jgi:hypothetical protein
MRWLCEQLLRIPVLVLCVAAVTLFALLSVIGDRAGESGVLLVPPFGLLWLVTGVLVLVHAHRAVARSSNSLVRFAAPIAAALAFLICSAYAGDLVASWVSTRLFPHQRLLP